MIYDNEGQENINNEIQHNQTAAGERYVSKTLVKSVLAKPKHSG